MTNVAIEEPLVRKSGVSPLRIVHVVRSLEIGGLERLVVDLAKEQRRSGHEVEIYCLYRLGPFADEAQAAGVPVTCFGKTDGINPAVLLRIAGCLRRARPQVVHTHNPLVHHYGAIAGRLAGVPVVINTLHHPSRITRQPKEERVFRAILPFTNAVAMVSITQEPLAGRYSIPREKTTVILNGISTERFTSQRALPGSALPRVRFGTLGRLIPRKDHATLIRAFAMVISQLPEAELYIGGEGPERPALERMIAEASLGDRVNLGGTASDTPTFLSNLDVFVLSSLSEGLSVAMLEAMASGLPIISTCDEGTSEAAPDGLVAWYCPPASPEDLARTMLHVASDVDLRSAGDRACRIAQQRFSIASTAAGYEKCYRSFLPVQRQ